MSQNDIRLYKVPGGVAPVIWEAPMKASETFRRGEPISINAAGEATESADDPVPMDVIGIALEPVEYVIGSTSAAGTASTRNPKTGAAYATGAAIQYVPMLQGYEFISQNFATDGAGTLLFTAGTGLTYATAFALLGECAGMSLTSGVWSIDTGTTTDLFCWRITAFLDARQQPIHRTGQNAFYVVVTPIQGQTFPISDAAGALAAIA